MKGCRLVRHDGSTARANPTVNLALPAPHAPTPSTPNMLHVALSACHRPTPVDSQPLALRPQLTAYACSSYRQARITAVARPPALDPARPCLVARRDCRVTFHTNVHTFTVEVRRPAIDWSSNFTLPRTESHITLHVLKCLQPPLIYIQIKMQTSFC